MPDGRPTVAIAHAAFLGGGGEAVALWGIQALARSYDVTLITLLPIDIAAMDAFYGTSLQSLDFRVVPLLRPNGLTRRFTSGGWLFTLRQQFVGWHVRRRGREFDLLISTFNEMDLGRPGVQYIHAPLFSAYSSEARKLLRYPDSLVRRAWKFVCGKLFGASERRMRENLSATNSEWTASLLSNTCHIPAGVVYPPVRSTRPDTNWPDRRDSFLCVARFVRDKRLELAIRVIDGVRARGFDVGLHIVGHVGDAAYFSSLLGIQKTRSSWLTFDTDVSRSELTRLLHHYKYGIHPREAEQFGIGVAEMAASGCVPFVPAAGGQAEIVGRDSRLLFDTTEDAVEKIVRVLNSAELQESVRRKVIGLADSFSATRFMENFRRLADDAMKAGAPGLHEDRNAEAFCE